MAHDLLEIRFAEDACGNSSRAKPCAWGVPEPHGVARLGRARALSCAGWPRARGGNRSTGTGGESRASGSVPLAADAIAAPPALEAGTLCRAFQLTPAERADQVALRTPGDAVAITYREYAERVRRIAGGLAGLGVGRGDTVALMLVNRPEFNLVDTAALHLGCGPVFDLQHFRAGADRVLVLERRNQR
jgi:AMP-binding enzyme